MLNLCNLVLFKYLLTFYFNTMFFIRIILTITLLSLIVKAQCQTNWHWYNPQPDGNGLMGICLVDETHAWAVGEFGKILFYNGYKWEKQESGTNKMLLSVHFSDTIHGYAVGDSGILLKYDNGSWINQSLPINKPLSKVYLTSVSDGWIASDTLFRLINGQWIGYPYHGGGYCTSIEFTSPNNGYISDYDNLYHFDGNAWSKVEGPESNYFSGTTDISFADKDHGMLMIQSFFGSTKKILRYDHGKWDSIPGVTFKPISLVMTDSANAVISAYDFNEADYPNSSAMIKFNSVTGFHIDTIVHLSIMAMDISNTGQMGTVGYNGNIYLTKNNRWHLSNSIDDSFIKDMSFPDYEHGWAVHKGGLILKWASNGWVQDTLFSKLRFEGVHFSDSGYGWAIGCFGDSYLFSQNTAMIKYDKGSWQITDTLPTALADIFVLDRKHVWAAGLKSIYFYDGVAWTEQFSNPQYRYFKTVYALDSIHVWAAGEGYMWAQGVIWFYDGISWKSEYEDFACEFTSMWVCDSATAFITDRSSGQVLKYNRLSGEYTFMPIFVGYLNSIRMFNANSGWVTGDNGALAYFDGTKWNPVDLRTHTGFKVICFADREHGWLSGDEGTMLSTYAWSPLVIHEQEQLSDQPSLLRVYPNPVSSQAIIEYTILVANMVTLKIFNIEGKLVLFPVNEFKREGLHQINLNMSNLKSGIYFCELNDGRKVSSIKLIKLD